MEEIAHVLACLDRLTDEGGTDFEHRRIDQTHTGRQSGNIDRITRTGINQDMVLGQQAFRLVPAGEGEPIVRPDNQVEGVLRIDFLQTVERMDGIGGLGQMEFKIRSTEFGIALYGQLYQFQPQGIGQQVLPHLEGIAGSDQKPQFVQPAELTEVIGQRQMADVNGIERTAEDADIHNRIRFSFPSDEGRQACRWQGPLLPQAPSPPP